MRYCVVLGTRPNYLKAVPICREFEKQGIDYKAFDPGQHYDYEMGAIFEEQLPIKDLYKCERKEDNQIKNVEEMMRHFDNYLSGEGEFDYTIVIGDVNASLACALVSNKHNIPVIHIEAGLRSFDIRMPEELNRITIDHISRLLFATCQDGLDNLSNEGIVDGVFMMGNTACDTIELIRPKLIRREENHNCILVTLHRPENIDNAPRLEAIMKQIAFLARRHKVIFPIHPRTRKAIDKLGLEWIDEKIFSKPLGYMEMISIMSQSYAVITDSGGIQEETSYLGVNCLTVRDNTERPITITQGTNRLVVPEKIADEVAVLSPAVKKEIPFWDGKAAGRIVETLLYLEQLQ